MNTAKELQHAFISFSLKYFYYGLKKCKKKKQQNLLMESFRNAL